MSGKEMHFYTPAKALRLDGWIMQLCHEQGRRIPTCNIEICSLMNLYKKKEAKLGSYVQLRDCLNSG